MGDEVDKVAEGDDASGSCSCWGGEEDVSLRLVLSVLIQKIFAVISTPCEYNSYA